MAVQTNKLQVKPFPISVLTRVVGVPAKTVVEPTKPKPFNLLADKRVTVKSEHRKQMLKEEEREWIEATTFKARPNTVTLKEPFRLRKQNRVCQPTKGPELRTEKRTEEWRVFNERKRCREALLEIMEQERLWEEAQIEKMAVAKLRQEQVHKAQPIRHYKPVEPKVKIPVTVPQSPAFSQRLQ